MRYVGLAEGMGTSCNFRLLRKMAAARIDPYYMGNILGSPTEDFPDYGKDYSIQGGSRHSVVG